MEVRVKPKCGWRWVVFDENGAPKSIWAWLSEAKDSCKRNGKAGWTVRHEGCGKIILTIFP